MREIDLLSTQVLGVDMGLC